MQWVYKATRSKVGPIDTMILADKRGFLCRSAYDAPGKWASNVQGVAVGDTIHFYYVRPGKPVMEIGSFEVVAPARHPKPAWFGAAVGATALREVVDATFAAQLNALKGYAVDPVVGKYTGWPLVKTGNAPAYEPTMFPARATLHRYP